MTNIDVSRLSGHVEFGAFGAGLPLDMIDDSGVRKAHSQDSSTPGSPP